MRRSKGKKLRDAEVVESRRFEQLEVDERFGVGRVHHVVTPRDGEDTGVSLLQICSV